MKSLYTTACAAAILAALSFPQAAKALEFSVSESQTLPATLVTQSLPTSFTGTFTQNATVSTSEQLSPWTGTASPNGTYSVLDGQTVGTPVNPSDALYNQVAGTTTLTFMWGSPDSYNSVELFSGQFGTGTNLGTITGTFLTHDTPGSGYDVVTFTALGGFDIGSIELINAGTPAFEYANVPVTTTVSQTPIPGALPLVAGGLALIGLLRRRNRQAATLPA